MRWEFKRKKRIGFKRYEIPKKEPLYKNPLFPKEKKRMVTTFRKFFYSFLFLVFLVTTIYFLFFSIIFEVKEVKIEGNRFISSKNIENIIKETLGAKRFLIFKQNNILFFSKKKAHQDLVNKIQEKQALVDAKITKIYPDTLKISINERIPRLVLLSSGKRYFIDLDGVITRDIAPNEEIGIEFSKISYTTDKVLSIGDTVINPEFIKKALEIKDKLSQRTDKINMDSFQNVEDDEHQIWVNTQDGWQIFFDITSDIETQIDKLILVLEKKEIDRNRLNYIDVRFPERVYISPPLE
ncbi:MAG: hypothetical protein ACD_12C00464G0004 [uncultured bacterium]|nr:MAG: hypothetical protein ACD_12C00464G0004 [uncultured bacterium]